MTSLLAFALLAGAPAPGLFCEIADKRIDESSGLAPSIRTAGEYWTHNDSGDTARFFRFGADGKITAEFRLTGAKAVDWEDMASARVRGVPTLLLADVGDNRARREGVTIYRLREPVGAGGDVKDFDTIEVRYADKPHDCETILVDPASGDIYLVAKVFAGPSGVYRIPAPRGSGSVTAQRIGEIKLEFAGMGGQAATGGAVSMDGKRVAVRTYRGAAEFRVTGKFQDWWKSKQTSIAIANETQGESICYRMDGRAILTTSEGSPCRVSISELP